ncbi:hypothetical protein LNQ03_31620 [Klebsiella pneumoniae subsp. pneumoniae]|nr:hypothetical protein [Klebsiella pneumoniae subsp. pneumoniae]
MWINQQAVNPLTAKLPRTEGLERFRPDRTIWRRVKEVVPQLRFASTTGQWKAGAQGAGFFSL